MTIYDSDYTAELAAEEKAEAGVMEPVAEVQEAIPQDPLDHIADNGNMVEEQPEGQLLDKVEELTDKEMNFRAMREEIAKMKAEKEALEQNFDTWKRELATQRQPEAPRKSAIDELPDDDIITGAQLKKLLAEKEEAFQRTFAEQEMYNQEARMKSQYSDYDEVATKYGVPLLKLEPDLAQAFVAAKNKPAFLYKLGKMQQVHDSPAPAPSQVHPQTPSRAERIIANARKPGTLSNTVASQQAISKADYYASMDESQFQALVKKNLEEV